MYMQAVLSSALQPSHFSGFTKLGISSPPRRAGRGKVAFAQDGATVPDAPGERQTR
jgi:hypothetical protein